MNMRRAILLACLLFSFLRPYAQEEDLSIRDERPVALSFEAGWNGLAGLGLNLNYYASPYLSIDGGIGLSTLGIKLGVRTRYIITREKFAPYVGVGLIASPSEISDIELDDIETEEKIFINTSRAQFLQLVGGFEYIAKGGFLIGMNLGYAISFKDKNYEVVSQNASEDMIKTLDILYGSGIVIGFNIGYAF